MSRRVLRRSYLWAVLSGLVASLGWWYIGREPKWFESYYNGVTRAWPPQGKG